MIKFAHRILRRSAFTLLELLIVMALIAMVAGVVGINIVTAVREQRFRSEVNLVVDKLRLAQDLMLIMGIGASVKFEVVPGSRGISMKLETQMPLPGYWDTIVKASQLPLTSIHRIQIEGIEKEGKLEVRFLSEEAGITKGILRLSTSQRDDDLGALTEYICLPGYPTPLISEKLYNNSTKCDLLKEEEFVKNLSKFTYNEISEISISTTPSNP